MTSVILALLLGASPAAAQPAAPTLEITEARTEAAGYALAHSLLVTNLVRNCLQFSDALAQDPQSALAGWRRRNADRVDGARGYMIYARAAIERRLGAQAADEYYAKVTGEFAGQARGTLHDIFSAAGPQPGVCDRWLAAIAEGQADLDQQPKYLPLLDEILAFHRSLLGTPR